MIDELDDAFWNDLVTRIGWGEVIPVVGPGAVTFGLGDELLFPGSHNDYLPRTNKETQIPRTSHRAAARCACRRIPGNSARPNGGDFSPRLDPAARPDDHQNHSAHGGCNAEEHKENAPRESGADSIYSGGTGDIRRLLASGTCHQRGDEIHPKQAKPHK